MNKFDIKIDILVYNGYPKLKEVSRNNFIKYSKIYPSKIVLKAGIFILLPFSYLYYMISLIFELVKRDSYDFIHARTDYSAFIAICTKPFHGLPVVWDCRGDALDEIRSTIKTHSIFIRLCTSYLLFRHKIFIYINKIFSDKIIVVSTSLRTMLGISAVSSKVLVVPCSVPEEFFVFDKSNRKLGRLELGLGEDDVLFVYSGSMIGYQSINRLVEFANRIVNLGHQILIMTKDIEQYKLIYKKSFPTNMIHVKSVEYEDISKFYCAADFGIILRDDTPTNKVASPTKFGEYCMTGLKVVHNHTVDQVSEITRKLGNGAESNARIYEPIDDIQRIIVSEKASKIFGRNSSNLNYVAMYGSI